MRKRLLVGTFVAALALSAAGSAAANKNSGVVEAQCDNGESISVLVNFTAGERSGENAATPIVGGGSFKTTELRLFVHETAQEIFSITTNFPQEPTVTCEGTVFEPKAQETFDFVVSGVIRPGK